MRFNATLNVDFAQWRAVKMERDNALQNNRQIDEEMPKFGAGSEYNRELKEELRRKRFGINPKKYKPEAQPWILKTGKNGKKFRGIREGGVGENAAFYVFTHAPDKTIEAYPLHEWYNFQPIQRYKSLSAEEAELEFGRRKKVLNYFSLMLRKRLKGEEADDGIDDAVEDKKVGKGKGKTKANSELKISDMDEWIDSDDDSSDSDKDNEKDKESDGENDAKKKKAAKGADAAKAKKKKRDVDGEAFEDSDDGDEEGRELDYISDSSEDVSDLDTGKEMKGVAEEDALRKLLTSDESEAESEKSNEDEEKEEEAKEKEKESKDKKKKKAKKTAKDKKESSSDFSTDSDSDAAETQEKKRSKNQKKDGAGLATATNSRTASPGPDPSTSKRKGQGSSLPSDLTTPDSSNSPVNTPAKKPRLESMQLPASFAGVVSSSNKDDYGITEEAVRRYLLRKPMTTTELLTKFKNKKTGVSSEKLVDTMTQILKRINPVRQTIMGKMYLSIKVDK